MDYEIITNPTTEQIENDVDKSEIVSVIYGSNIGRIMKMIKDFEEGNEFEIIYIRYYPKDSNKYTMGLNKKKVKK